MAALWSDRAGEPEQMVTKGRVLDLREVKVFVLDEADNMLESGSMGDQSITLKK